MKEGLRNKLLRWLRSKSKVEIGMVSPKWIIIIWSILFPIQAIYLRNKIFNYDCNRGVFTFYGIKYAQEIFETFGKKDNIGKTFKIISSEYNTIAIERID